MSSKEKDSMSKLKQFFKTGTKNTTGGLRDDPNPESLEREFNNLSEKLCEDVPIQQRCKFLNDLSKFVAVTKLDEKFVLKLWDLTKDIISNNRQTEYRQTTLHFYKNLLRHQSANLSIMREFFFNFIRDHNVEEDLQMRVDMMVALSENGKQISTFEEKIGQFMLDLAPSILLGPTTLIHEYLDLLSNIIQYNASHLESEILVGFVNFACQNCLTVNDQVTVTKSMNILELVMSYAMFPKEALFCCVGTLCRTVNNPQYFEASWKNMKNLLGIDLGYSALTMMCDILKDRSLYENQDYLLRGAVFHTCMGVFGIQSQPNKVPLASATVLISFLRVLECKKVIVTFEIVQSIKLIIQKYNLPERLWDLIFEILNSIADNLIYYDSINLVTDSDHIKEPFHKIIDDIENMLKLSLINSNLDSFYDLIEKISDNRSDESVKDLIKYRSSQINTTRPQWLQSLQQFIKRFYQSRNSDIRIQIINSLVEIMDSNRTAYEEEILERVVIPEFSNIINFEKDMHVRLEIINALISFGINCDTTRCVDILDMLQKILQRPFQQFEQTGYVIANKEEGADIIRVTEGLIDIFKTKLYKLPSSNAIHVFNILISHLERYYKQPNPFYNLTIVRKEIFSWMLEARANSVYHIGYPDQDKCLRFSHYLGVETNYIHDESANNEQISQTNYTSISIARACKTIISALKDDHEYDIFFLIVSKLPSVLENKALIQGNSIDNLAEVLIKVFSRKKFQKQSTDDFNTLMLPSIASLVIHHQTIQIPKLELIMDCLKNGLNQKIASTCINTLTIMVLERHDVLNRKLKDVLLTMSKMSDTQAVAIPVLEFLSVLCQLPNQLFASYIPMEHMYIFAAIMPYTKPYKYNPYIVSLAYHVIAKWFLKNKPIFRRNYVKYIISSIETSTKLLNEDSSNRKRSTSLTERGNRSSEAVNTNDIIMDETMRMFHEDLAETCIDFLARHTYSPFSALPKRLPVVETLLKDGISQSWLIGHNLMTITTSNCSSGATNGGFCERCFLLNRQTTSSSTSSYSLSDKTQNQNSTRYTKASLQYSNATESCGSSDLTGNTVSSMSSYHLSIEGNNSNSKSTSRQASTSSTGSIDISSRRGSNPDALNGNKDQMLNLSNTNLYSTNASSESSIQQKLCVRSCTGWAELCIRRPTGIISWVMRIQNPISTSNFPNEMPFSDLISLFLPSAGGAFEKNFFTENPSSSNLQQPQSQQPQPSEEESKQIKEKKPTKIMKQSASSLHSKTQALAIDIPNSRQKYADRPVGSSYSDDDEDKSYEDSSGKLRNPVRRVNSSPEMRSKYLANREKEKEKEQQIHQTQQINISDWKKKCQKNTKKSCEAIPEENSGSTPPQILPKQSSADDIITNTSTKVKSNLVVNIPKDNLSSKPPSPTPLSPRSKNSVNFSTDVSSNNNYDQKNQRGRANTISVVRGVNKNTPISFLPNGQTSKTPSSKLGISPSFLLLQLYHTGKTSFENPIKISSDNTNSIKILDYIPPLDIHKIGVLYVGPGQCNNEAEILRNRHGSTRYIEFLKNLGTLVSLKTSKENNLFINLETNGSDGLFTYVWMDDIMQVIFHVATLMPTKDSDPKCNEKKKHIGNDYTSIVYNESGDVYDMNTIRGQCNYACVIVEPIEMSTCKISIVVRPEISNYIGNPKPKIVSDRNAPLLARQLALHADLASAIVTKKKNNPYASNWLERLRKIKNLRVKELQKVNRRDSNEVPSSGSSSDISKITSPPSLTTNNFKQNDFTTYTEDS